jgi:hypothetical protein
MVYAMIGKAHTSLKLTHFSNCSFALRSAHNDARYSHCNLRYECHGLISLIREEKRAGAYFTIFIR